MKVIDISSKLTNEKPIVKVTEDVELMVRNDKNTVLLVQQELEKNDGSKSDVEKFDTIMKLMVGDIAVRQIDALELSFVDYLMVVKAVLAAATGEEIETIEARFQ